MKAGAALAGDVEARDPRRPLGQQALLDAPGDLEVAVLALLLDAQPVQARPFEGRLRLAHERGGEVQVLGERRARAGTGAHGQQAREPARRQQRDDEGELGGRHRVAQASGRQLGHEPRLRQVAGERRRVARQVRRQRAGPGPARVAELEARGGGVVERRPRREEVAHHGRDHQALDHLLVERRRQLAADVEQVLELVHPDREVAVDAPQLLVDEPALDRRRRRGGQALEKRHVLGREGPAVAAGPEPEKGDQPAGLSDRAQQHEPRLGERRLVRAGREGLLRVEARPQALGHGPRQPARRPPLEARLAAAHVERTRGDVELAHHEAEHRVRNLVAARRPDEARREVVQRHELRQPRDERRLAPLAAQRLELLAAPLDDRDAHRASRRSPAPSRFTRQQTLPRAVRRNVTVSMMRPIRCTPRPPRRPSLA